LWDLSFGLNSFLLLRSFLIFKDTDRALCSGVIDVEDDDEGVGGIHGFAVRNGDKFVVVGCEEFECGFGVGSL
jgi:hypothetical protein